MPLSDYRSALVTGASSGFGQAIARDLAARGIQVHAAARRADRLDALAAETGAVPHALDLRQPAAIYDRFGDLEIDILVHSAGMGSPYGAFTEMDPADIDATIEINLTAGIHLVRALSPGMVARGRGHIVTLGSIFGLHAIGSALYGASKGGVHLLSQNLRHELQGSGIRISEICPGRARTEFFDSGGEGARERMFGGFQVLEAQDVSEAVLYALDQPWRVNVSLIELTATEQIPGGASIVPVGGKDRER
ncbi:MAG: SDR family oxidoreductase [Alphaproteobacteria bacterium]|jgi:NADP-dependent 3-hydroxy acid dehydrogenase YdfG|nr:SDR family oxidoreductase [Alphaproteobacteria bacterium]